MEKNLRKEICIQVYDSEISQEKLLGRAVYENSKTETDAFRLKSFDGSFIFQSFLETTEKRTVKNPEKISLALTIAKAKDLEKSDYIGKSDPYIVATYGDKVFKSKTVNNDQNPNWNFSIILELEEPLERSEIIVEIFDEDYDEDDRIGEKVFNIQELLSCDKIEDQWVDLDKCKSGEIMFSSKVTRREIRESLRIETSTTEELIPRKSTSTNLEGSQEFDKLHKKSFQMIVRKTDAEGNIVEEIFDENKNPSGVELSEINISSGIEISSSVEADDYLHPTMKKSSISEFRIPKLSQDNLNLSESPKTTTVTSSVTIENIEFVSDDENDEKLIRSIKGLQESTKSKMQSLMETVKETKTVETSNFFKRKVVKSIDQDGNVTEEVIYEGRPKSIVENLDSPTEDSSAIADLEQPLLSVQGLSAQVLSSNNNSFVQYFTSSSQPFETINSFRAHFVESYSDRPDNTTTASISQTQGRSLYMLASGEPSIDDLHTGSNFTSMMDPTLCNSCIREPSQTESYMTNSDSFMTSNTLDDVVGFSESSNQELKISKSFTQTTVDSTPIISSVSISHSYSDPQERSSELILSEGNSAIQQGTCFT